MKATWILAGVASLLFFHVALGREVDFITIDFLNNRKRNDAIGRETLLSEARCKELCFENLNCDSYAYNKFSLKCEIYNSEISKELSIVTGYRLFVAKKDLNDGYYLFEGSFYIKSFVIDKTFDQAQKHCKDQEGGDLASITNKKLNDILTGMMAHMSVWTAWFYLTDRIKEDTWINSEGIEQAYENWDPKEKYYNIEKNCALITTDGEWRHENCDNHHYFFCSIPIYA